MAGLCGVQDAAKAAATAGAAALTEADMPPGMTKIQEIAWRKKHNVPKRPKGADNDADE